MKKRPELLLPVQNWKSLHYLGNYGDAIYFGVQKFNMRQKADNFDMHELEKVAEYCHCRDPPLKCYLCTNILIYNSELNDLETLISSAAEAEIDAIIAHDIAAIQAAKRNAIPFHVSTQANISNIESARFFENLGAERLVLSRELSLDQIATIKRSLTHAEVECFVHGSMCTSISGRCYLSASITGNEQFSANRGNCVQPCRRTWSVIDDNNNELVYDGQLFLNSKDLCMIGHIPELIEADIDAFKIEGRMKDPLYIKTVAKCYQRAIDAVYQGTFSKEKVGKWMERLEKVYNRGFHTGFYFGTPSPDDIELNKRGNISTYKKKYIGKVLNYHPSIKTADILIEAKDQPIAEGDTIVIIGDDTYAVEKLRNILLAGKKVRRIKRTSETEQPIKVNIGIDNIIESKDKIYILKLNHSSK